MKICILSFTNLRTDGGEARRILKEMRTLAEAGFDVKAIGLLTDQALPKTETYYGATIERERSFVHFDRTFQKESPNRSFFSSIRRAYTLVAHNTLASSITLFKLGWKENADVYHCFNIYSLFPGFLFKLIKRRKLVYDAAEVPHLNIRRISALGIFAKPLSQIVGVIETSMASYANIVFTIPSVNDEYYKRFEKVNKNTIVLRNTPPTEWGRVENGSIVLKDYPDQKILLYIGTFTRAKGIMKMVQAFEIVHRQLEKVKFVLVGSFDEIKAYDNVKEEFMAYTKDHDLENYIKITGFVNWSKIPEYLSAADIALQVYQPDPIFMQSQGSSSLPEYMSASLPIVVNDFPNYRDIVEGYNCGITVDPTDERKIANAILRLLNDDELRQTLGQNSRKAFENEFNWGLEEKKLIKAYQTILPIRAN